MADKNLTVGIDIKADTADAKKASDALDRVADSATKTTDKAGKVKTGMEAAAAGLSAVGQQAGSAGEGMGGATQAAGMLMSALAGGGIVGVIDLVVQGLMLVADHFDVFGSKAKAAAEDAADLSNEMMQKADAAYLDAKATEAATRAEEDHNQVLETAIGRYKAVLEQAQAVTRQRKEQADSEIAAADAQAGLSMAQLQLQEATGKITKEDAIIKRGQIQMEAEARKQAAKTAAEEAKIAEQRKKAAAEDELAKKRRVAAIELEEKSVGLLNETEKKSSEQNKMALESNMAQSQLTQQRMAEDGDAAGLAQEQAKYQEMITKLAEEKAKIAAHEKAVMETGVKSRDELNQKVEEERKAAAENANAAKKAREEASYGEARVRQSGELFNVRQTTAATATQAGVESERAAKKAEEEKAKAAAEKSAEKELAQVGTAGGRAAVALEKAGFDPKAVSMLQSAVDKTASGGSSADLVKLMESLMANLKNMDAATRDKVQKLQAEIDDLKLAK